MRPRVPVPPIEEREPFLQLDLSLQEDELFLLPLEITLRFGQRRQV